MEPSTGDETWRIPGPAFLQSAQAGIAVANDQLWISTWFGGPEPRLTGHFAVLDPVGAIVATAHAAMFDGLTTFRRADGMQLAWSGANLVLHYRDQIVWFDPQPGP